MLMYCVGLITLNGEIEMNKRLAQLYDQAIVLESNGDYVAGELDLVKFYELIVRKCVEVSINNGCGDFVDIEQKLFEHFGVR